jgi:hypothetical protein
MSAVSGAAAGMALREVAENLFPAARGKKKDYIKPASRIFAFIDSRS